MSNTGESLGMHLETEIRTFLARVPKVELHIHIEGSLEPELMFAMAERNRVKLKYPSVEAVREAYRFQNLQSFLDIYYDSASVLLHEQDYYDMMMAYFERIQSQNVLHAEIFFDPQTHTHRGVPFEVMMSGLQRAVEDGRSVYGISSHLIMCFLRHLSEESAFQTLQQALPYKDGIVAVGLDSYEVGNPPSRFTRVFEQARRQGFLTVAHAGEEGPPEYIWQALELLHVARIDHGVRCMQDEALVDELVRRQVPLTVCPLSNVKLGVFANVAEHNLKQMLERGLCVTINSDDPAYFGGYIGENFTAVQQALPLGFEDVYQLTKNAIYASFLDEDAKRTLFDKASQVYQANIP